MGSEHDFERDRREAFVADFATGLARYLMEAEMLAPMIDKLQQSFDRGSSARGAERARVKAMLARDRQDRAEDARRDAARAKLADEDYSGLEIARLGPTREQASHAEYVPVIVEKHEGRTVRATETVRRASTNRVKQLHDRGVLTDETYPAVLWYQRQYEASGLDITASAASWGEHIAGERAYGHLPRSQTAAEARANFRFARGGTGDGFMLPADMLPTFDAVVLAEMTITDAARAARCRYTRADFVVRHVALLLLGRIAHLLPVRAVGAPGSAPAVEMRLESVVTAQALSNAVYEMETGRREVAPQFLNARGLMRPFAVIAKIVRGEPLTDEEDAA